MPVIKYNDLEIIAQDSNGNSTLIPASTVSVSLQNSLAASRILAPNQNNNFRIGGESVCKINIAFLACNATAINPEIENGYSTNFGFLTFGALTGRAIYLNHISIGNSLFQNCYLDKSSLNISPFAPSSITAEFTCLNPPTGQDLIPSPTTPIYFSNDKFAYGFDTVISGGSLLSDGNIENLTYSVTCNRTYSTTIGANSPNAIFLNEIEKELSIKARNIGKFINYSGYGDAINIDLKNSLGESILTLPSNRIQMSSNSRIVSQNLSMEEGGILAGDISLREIVL
jgi:hypothetical protein